MSVLNLHHTLKKAKECRDELQNIKVQVQDKTKNYDEVKTKLDEHENTLSNLLNELQTLKDGFVSKNELSIISDEISECLEQFVINNTPRSQNEELLNKIKQLEERMNEMEHQPVSKQAQDTEQQVIPALHFRKPVKKILK